MEGKIITVSREFGSGGRTIAKEIAKRLGIPYYDKEIIKEVAEKTGFNPEYVEEAGEHAPGKSLFSFGLGGSVGLSTSDFLWAMQRQVILEIAQKGPCVIVGRCADYILKDNPDAVHIFIHADMDFKIDRVVRLYGESEKKPEARINDKNKKRAVNYKHFTNREWGKSQNYHIALNSKALGIEKCIEAILSIVTE